MRVDDLIRELQRFPPHTEVSVSRLEQYPTILASILEKRFEIESDTDGEEIEYQVDGLRNDVAPAEVFLLIRRRR